ncbi:MAG: ABC transporter ATP-binding protein [Ilumatobacter sp.]|jgi:branched-chain amino acid transport system ATP-binding protein|nr:ABC transporter ATP-binding protein [Ilumatobacter sp.]MDG1695337.1 ABC transporter ATP-binding protein [Ilumatobacter sp.]MDG2438544.1 ABC transporter ATP-binding protein [Ilumatobacter sp.]
MALLEARGVTVTYGGVRANNAINLDCAEGSLVGLIGPNGAGKTTFIDAITGYTPASEGSVTFDGRDITRASPSTRARAGLTRTFQSLELFEDLTVRDNLLAAAEWPTWHALFVDVVAPRRRAAQAADRVDQILDMMDLAGLADRLPAELSHGRRRLISVARAFAAAPRLVLLDEPAAGLDTDESRALGVLLREVVDDGTALLLVDHDMGLILDVCDHINVIDFGSVIASASPTAIRNDPAVIEAYLGTQHKDCSR